MLVCLLGLWQGMGWAETYSYSVDGYEYEIRDFTTKKYARLLSIPNTETVRIPADVTYNGVVYPLTKIRSKIESDNVKDIYFTRVLPTNVQTGELEFRGHFGRKSIVNIHVPDSLYEDAYKLFPSKAKYYYYLITDGTRWGFNGEYYYYDENGFTFEIHPNADTPYAKIYDIPDEDNLHFPSTVTHHEVTYPVTGVYSRKFSNKTNVKNIYFSNCYAGALFNDSYAPGVTAHVPDSLFEKITIDGNYGKITDGKRWAYSRDIHPICNTQGKDTYSTESYYDITENGKMDFWGYSNGNLFVSTIDGSIVRKEDNNENQGSTVEAFEPGMMGMYDKDGFPILVTTHFNYNPTTKFYSYAKNAFIHSAENIPYATIADLNGDGRKEIVSATQDRNNNYNIVLTTKDGSLDIFRMAADGTFVADKIYVTSDTTVVKSMMLDDYTPNSGKITATGGGSNNVSVPSIMDGMFVKAKPAPDWNDWQEYDNITSETSQAKQVITNNGKATRAMAAQTGYVSAADINGDGMIDLYDGTNIYYNIGGNKFFKSAHTGTIYSADLTGNGLLDFIDFGNKQVDLYLSMAENNDMQVKTLLKNTAISNTFFGDFDKDGDVDILFVIPGSDYTIFQFYRNDGNGVFKPKDTNLDGTYTCQACNDYDGDGLYEILAVNKGTSKNVLLKLNNKWSVAETELPAYLRTIGDVNNDGTMEMVYNNSKASYTIYDAVPNSKVNTRPAKMEKPSAVAYADAGKLKISWTRGKDAETSACDLTYELRIGSESGKGDIYFGKSNADGTRRVLEDGNMGRALKYMFDTGNLCEGKYYIAIQAIDASGLGGPWSDEFVYDHKTALPVINKLSDGYCTSDTITMTVQNPNINATYEWNISNGTIISQNDNGSIVDVVFNRGGEQNVTVNMTLGNLMYKSETKTITLSPSKYAKIPAANDKTLYSQYTTFLDLNQDGNVEVLGYANESGWFENKEGLYSKIRKTWNSDLGGSSDEFFIADFNHDGYPDFYYPHSKGNLFTNSGEEDGSFEYETETFDFGFDFPYNHSITNIDFNNDGKLNFLVNSLSLYTNNGDERKFSKLNDIIAEQLNIYSDGFFDFDRDGGLDIWKNEIDYSIQKAQTKVYFKVAGENNQFNPAGAVFYENERRYNMKGFADFNNDGYVDGYFLDHPEGQDYYNMVIVKGKPMSEWPCKETVVIPLKECTFYAGGGEPSFRFKFVDFSNNGYLDICVGNSIYLMDKDFTYTELKNVKTQYGFNFDYFDEYHWQPLTPGAYPNGYKSSIKNEAPSVPTHVTATSVPEGLLLKWDDATDDHTPWMQMRYNVSLKIKGKTGENAFVLSPMNGLSDEAAICSGVYYRKATQLIVPKTALVNGTTYELQVQAIDLMGEHSAMTKPVEVTYNAEKMIMIDENEHYTGLAYYGKCTNVSGNDFTIDPGEGGNVLQHRDGGIFSLKWNTPGVKTITFKDGNDVITKMVNVKLLPDLTINLPERVMLNTPLTVRVPECFQTGKYADFGFKESEAYKATFEKGDTIATIVFKEVGKQSLQPYVKIEKDLNLSEQFKTMIVDETMPAAEIKSVESNGKYYQVNWSTDVPSMVSKVEVSRETNRLNQFEVLDIVPVGNATYVDLTSDNRVQPQRYRIRLIAENEMQHSDYSAAHNPLHVMINKTADKKGNNLMWNAYEGLEVTSYIIMRGSSEKNLKAIATISGSQQNYTDYDAPAGVSYYAVKFETNTSAGAKGMGRVAASEDVSSNVISSEEAMPTTQATTLYAGTVESIAKLSNSQQQLHMVATILPTYVTFNKVSWSIVSGGEYASISQSGLLTAKGGKGDVVVRVVTQDGSNLSCEITIPCDVNILASDIDVRASKKTVAVGDYLLLNAVLTPKNATMSEVTWKSENTDVATIDENGILKAISTGMVKITATTKDGSNLSAFINITVTEASGIHGVTMEDENENTEFYDLEGRKIQIPQKGRVYITNKGQKIAF